MGLNNRSIISNFLIGLLFESCVHFELNYSKIYKTNRIKHYIEQIKNIFQTNKINYNNLVITSLYMIFFASKLLMKIKFRYERQYLINKQ